MGWSPSLDLISHTHLTEMLSKDISFMQTLHAEKKLRIYINDNGPEPHTTQNIFQVTFNVFSSTSALTISSPPTFNIEASSSTLRYLR